MNKIKIKKLIEANKLLETIVDVSLSHSLINLQKQEKLFSDALDFIEMTKSSFLNGLISLEASSTLYKNSNHNKTLWIVLPSKEELLNKSVNNELKSMMGNMITRKSDFIILSDSTLNEYVKGYMEHYNFCSLDKYSRNNLVEQEELSFALCELIFNKIFNDNFTKVILMYNTTSAQYKVIIPLSENIDDIDRTKYKKKSKIFLPNDASLFISLTKMYITSLLQSIFVESKLHEIKKRFEKLNESKDNLEDQTENLIDSHRKKLKEKINNEIALIASYRSKLLEVDDEV